MRPRVVSVKPLADYQLYLEFNNGERKIFDAKPYLKGDWYSELIDPKAFSTVHIAGISVAWANGQDLCPDCLYYDSVNAPS